LKKYTADDGATFGWKQANST
jgi:hypothetical protein